ncbi:MAG: hypothetical protein JNJ75_08470 [Cyclobacteriaceae bacterium]|nr:hypothetical protein [Cyclobacteriaceae bacterium]
MATQEKLSDLKHGLGNFSNAELYYIISNLLGLGGLGEHMIEREKLLISFDENPDDYFVAEIKFFFMSKLPIISNTMTESETTFCFGKLNSDFEVELTIGSAEVSFIDPDDQNHDIAGILRLDHEKTHRYDPIRFVEGLERIITATDFSERTINSLFNFTYHTKIDSKFRQYLDLGIIGNTNYSGPYYLVVQPSHGDDTYSNIVNNFVIIDYPENIGSRIACRLTATEVREFESGERSTLLSEIDNLKLPIANRIRLALSDCSEEKKAELFENMNEDEFISYRVDVYLSVLIPAIQSNSYPPTGAEEVAWHECAGDILSEV